MVWPRRLYARLARARRVCFLLESGHGRHPRRRLFVVSEPFSRDGEIIVAALMADGADIDPWLATVPRHELYLTVLTRAEIRYGLSRLSAEKRRSRLTAEADSLFSETQERLLPFDAKSADRYGELVAEREGSGRRISGGMRSLRASPGFIAHLWQPGTFTTSTIAESRSSIRTTSSGLRLLRAAAGRYP